MPSVNFFNRRKTTKLDNKEQKRFGYKTNIKPNVYKEKNT